MFSSQVRAQTALCEITGEVTDPSGAPMIGVAMTLTNTATGIKTSLLTNEVGRYYLRSLPPGDYVIEAMHAGFKAYRVSGITLVTGLVYRQDFSLELGETSTHVEVAALAGAVEVQRDSHDISVILGQEAVQTMPKITGKVLELIALSPATVMTSKGGLNDNYAGASISFSVGGNPGTRSNMYYMDGVSMARGRMDGDGGNIADVAPNPEIIEEVKVDSRFSAEFGEGIGAVVLMASKAGTNEFHGQAYEFLQNDHLQARNFFATSNVNPKYKVNRFGGVLGGPVIKNRTFFFANVEEQRLIQWSAQVLTLPSMLQRVGDFSKTFNGAGALIPIYDQTTTQVLPNGSATRSPFSGNIIPASRFDSVGAKILQNYVPPPNQPGRIDGGNNFIGAARLQNSTRIWQFYRVDHQLTTKDRLYFRFASDSGDSPVNGAYVGTPYEVADPLSITQTQFQRVASGSWTRVISPTTISEAYIAYNNTPLIREALGNVPEVWQKDWAGKLGLKNVGPDTFPSLLLSGFQTIGSSASWTVITQTLMNSFSVGDTVSHQFSRHTVRFGGTIQRSRGIYATRQAASGQASFNTLLTAAPGIGGTGSTVASLLLGQVASATINDQPPGDYRSIYYAPFVQDDWRLNGRLTLNFGVRYEYDTPKMNVAENNSLFNFTAINPVCNCPGTIEFSQNTWRNVADFNHQHTQIYSNPKHNLAPRLGFAWTPLSKQDLVVRGGFGMFYVNSDMGDVFWNGPLLGSGVVGNWTSDAQGLQPAFQLSQGFPAVPVQPLDAAWGAVPIGQSPIVNPAFFWPTRRAGYSEQWNLTIQKRLGQHLVEGGYLGNYVHRLPQSGGYLTYNQVPPQLMGPGNAQLVRPFPQFGDVNGAGEQIYKSNYNAGYISVKRAMSHGLSFQASYTYSKQLDNMSPINFYNLQQSYGPGSLMRRHNYVWSSVYELPFGPGKALITSGLLSKVVGGWTLGNIWTWQTGAPLTVTTVSNTCNCFSTKSQRANLVSGVSFSRTSSGFDPALNTWFNTSAFTGAAPYTFGNSGKGILFAPNLFNVDSTLSKKVRINERYNLELRGEFLNTLNNVNFNGPNTTFGSGGFGTITSAQSPRQIQVAAAVHF
jgi:hypothetical protein